MADKQSRIKRQRGPLSVILRMINPQKVEQVRKPRPAVDQPFGRTSLRVGGRPEVSPGESVDVKILKRKKKK